MRWPVSIADRVTAAPHHLFSCDTSLPIDRLLGSDSDVTEGPSYVISIIHAEMDGWGREDWQRRMDAHMNHREIAVCGEIAKSMCRCRNGWKALGFGIRKSLSCLRSSIVSKVYQCPNVNSNWRFYRKLTTAQSSSKL